MGLVDTESLHVARNKQKEVKSTDNMELRRGANDKTEAKLADEDTKIRKANISQQELKK